MITDHLCGDPSVCYLCLIKKLDRALAALRDLPGGCACKLCAEHLERMHQVFKEAL